jgi:hypothetical protein
MTEIYMIVNFRIREINQVVRKLTRIPTLIYIYNELIQVFNLSSVLFFFNHIETTCHHLGID